MNRETASTVGGIVGVTLLILLLIRMRRHDHYTGTAKEEPRPFPSDPLMVLCKQLETDACTRDIIQTLRSPDVRRHLSNSEHWADWLEWLTEKGDKLRTLDSNAASERICLWRRYLDYYLWSDPLTVCAVKKEDSPPSASDGLPRVVTMLTARVNTEQGILLDCLDRLGIHRINATSGSSFVTGLVEPSPTTMPTNDQAMHMLVCLIEPGDGGYRRGATVLCPTVARPYLYCTEGTLLNSDS